MKFPDGSRVVADLYDQKRPATVIKVMDFTDRKGRLRERRLILLDEPVGDFDTDRRWNVEIEGLSLPQTPAHEYE